MSMFQEEISSKEKSEWMAVAIVKVVVEGRAANADNRLDFPTLKIVGSNFGTGPLPLFFNFFFRGAFALAVLSEREEVVSDCVVMDWCEEDFCLEPCLNEVLGLGMQLRMADFCAATTTVSFLCFVAVDRIRMVLMEVVGFVR